MGRPRISIYGLGYVGLIHAIGFALKGFEVVGYDIDGARRSAIKLGRSPIYEPGLEEALQKALELGRLRISENPLEPVLESDVSFIAVGTPSRSDGSADLSYVEQVSRTIGEGIRVKMDWHLVVVKSTVPPGTCEGFVRRIIEQTSGKSFPEDFGIASNPEFLREGNALEDFENPDRIVIGVLDPRSEGVLRSVYSFSKAPVIVTTPSTAELIKYANNAFLAMKVSFINMIANLCEKIPGCDVDVVAQGIGYDRRIGHLYLRAGPGWGGSCWLKDLRALIAIAKERGVEMHLVEATLRINEEQPLRAVEMAEKALGGLEGKRICLLGLAFKPNTDDVREAVSIKIARELLKRGSEVRVHDPRAMNNFRKIFGDEIIYTETPDKCLEGSDCAILITEWDDYRKIPSDKFKKLMKNPIVIDTRRIYSPEEFARKGVKIRQLGRFLKLDEDP